MPYYCLQIEQSGPNKSCLLPLIFCQRTNFSKLGNLFVKELCAHNAADTNFKAHIAAVSSFGNTPGEEYVRITIYSNCDLPHTIWNKCTAPLSQCKNITSACIRTQLTEADGSPGGVSRGGPLNLDI
jgi:hypothetical protein